MDRKLTLIVAAGVSLLALVMVFKFASFGPTALGGVSEGGK